MPLKYYGIVKAKYKQEINLTVLDTEKLIKNLYNGNEKCFILSGVLLLVMFTKDNCSSLFY